MNVATEGLPILQHQAGEFYAWLWWTTEGAGSHMDLGDPVGVVDLWVDERMAFRNPAETKVTAVMTGDNPGDTMEARAALAGGKVLQDLRLHLRRDDRDFTFTLKGAAMDLAQAKLPQAVAGGDEAIYDRTFLYDELTLVLAALLRKFARARVDAAWDSETLPAIRAWVQALPETSSV